MPVLTTTDVGRAQIEYPDYDYQKGTGLHTLLSNSVAFIGNALPSRWTGSQTLANTASLSVTHNFAQPLSALTVLFFNGSTGAQYSAAEAAARFTVTETNVNEIAIQNTSGGSLTFWATVLCFTSIPNTTLSGDVFIYSGTGGSVSVPNGTKKVVLDLANLTSNLTLSLPSNANWPLFSEMEFSVYSQPAGAFIATVNYGTLVGPGAEASYIVTTVGQSWKLFKHASNALSRIGG